MTWILKQLTSKLAGPIASGLALVLALALGWVIVSKNATLGEVRKQLSAVKVERDNAKADLNQCRANRLTLEEALARQTAAVDAAEAEGDARLAAVAKARDLALSSAAAANSRASAILRRAGSTCADADALILENVK